GVPAPRLYFLPNVVDTEWFKPSAPAPEKSLTVLAVGRLAKEKRLDRFISIVHRLRRDFHLNVRGLMVGPAAQNEDIRAQLENQARNLGLLPDGLEFRGCVSDVRSVYHEASLCILT